MPIKRFAKSIKADWILLCVSPTFKSTLHSSHMWHKHLNTNNLPRWRVVSTLHNSSPLFTFRTSLETRSWLLLRLASGFYYGLHQASIMTCVRLLLSLVYASFKLGSSLLWTWFKPQIKFTLGFVKVYLSLIPICWTSDFPYKQQKNQSGEEWWRVVKSQRNSSPP